MIIFWASDDVDQASVDDLIMFKMCKEFGWTPQQYKDTSLEDINTMLCILNLQRQKEIDDLNNNK